MPEHAFEVVEELLVSGQARAQDDLAMPYVRTCEAMLTALRGHLRTDPTAPEFWLGPKGVHLIGPITLTGLARNASARKFVQTCVGLGQAVAGHVPTVKMLERVLEVAKYPAERVDDPAELGIERGPRS
jgi:hypothetical protein